MAGSKFLSWLFLAILFFSNVTIAANANLVDNYHSQPLTNEFCIDQHQQCPEWAAAGECHANPAFMVLNCQLSCDSCTTKQKEASAAVTATAATYVDQHSQHSHRQEHEDNDHGEDMGVAQVLSVSDGTFTSDGNVDTREGEIRQMIAQARYYMTTIVPYKFGPDMSQMCQNKHEQCAYWAVLGECSNNKGFMTTNCAPVCQSCEALTVEGRCPIDPHEPQAWGPGDLNKMFERLTSEPYKSKYSVEILSSPSDNGPWVITMDNFVTESESERLIELGHERGYERSAGSISSPNNDGTYDVKYVKQRTSTNTWCDGRCMADSKANAVIERLTEITGIPRANSEYLQLLKYNEDQFYQLHHDYMPEHYNKQGGVRILTVFLYLNDVEAGGGTHFDELNMTVTPKRGRALIWPNVLNDAPTVQDVRTYHQALPVERGMKFAANAWYHMADFQTPLSMGCLG